MTTRVRNLPLLLAVVACNSEFVFPTLLRVQVAYLTPGWLILPPILLYLFLSKKADVTGFLRTCMPIVLTILLCVVSEAFVHDSSGVEFAASVGLSMTVSQTLNCLIACFIFYSLIREEADIWSLFEYLALSTIVNTVLLSAIARGLLSTPQIAEGGADTARIGLGDPNITFCYVSMGAVYWLTLANSTIRGNWRRTIVALACLTGSALPMILGLSRGALVSFVLCNILGLFLLAWAFSFRKFAKYALTVVLLGAITITWIAPARVDQLIQRFSITSSENYDLQRIEPSSRQRFEAIQWLAGQMRNPDILGKGYANWMDSASTREYPHFSLADLYIAGGVIPLILFLYFIFRNFLRLTIDVRREPDFAARTARLTLLAYVFTLLLMWMSLTIIWMKLLWAGLGVIARANQLVRERRGLLAEAAQSAPAQWSDEPVQSG